VTPAARPRAQNSNIDPASYVHHIYMLPYPVGNCNPNIAALAMQVSGRRVV
jgi:hypothetical protein